MDTDELEQADARKHTANGIVERTLLAHEAQELGLAVTPEQALEQVIRRGEIYNTISVDAPAYMRPNPRSFPIRNEAGEIEGERLDMFVGNMRRTMGEFAEWQAQEILAERMRDVIRSGVAVNPDEIWDQWVHEKEKATIRYARFSGAFYGARLDPTTADLDAFIASHAQQVNDAYAAGRAEYTDVPEQARARHILIKVEATADEATKAAARARAQALLAPARAADSRGFAILARANSEDTASAAKGGDLGWNPREQMVDAFDAAQFSLAPGQTSGLVETEFGFHIIRVEGRRQGDVPEVDAKRDLAEGLYRTEMGTQAARAAAVAMLARLRSGTSFDAIAAELSPPVPEGETAPQRDPNAPDVRTSDEFGPTDVPVQGLTDGLPVATAAFALTPESPLPSEPVRSGDEFVVFRLESRTHATREDLTAEERTRIVGNIRASKEAEAVDLYIRALRARAERAGSVDINPTILQYGTPENAESSESESDSNEAG
jgi:peptidyl-prolyl cis-trans isomerase D